MCKRKRKKLYIGEKVLVYFNSLINIAYVKQITSADWVECRIFVPQKIHPVRYIVDREFIFTSQEEAWAFLSWEQERVRKFIIEYKKYLLSFKNAKRNIYRHKREIIETHKMIAFRRDTFKENYYKSLRIISSYHRLSILERIKNAIRHLCCS